MENPKIPMTEADKFIARWHRLIIESEGERVKQKLLDEVAKRAKLRGQNEKTKTSTTG